MLALFAALLIAGNAQCVIACGFERCKSAEAPPAHCHQKSAPDKGRQPASAPCSHAIANVDTSALTVKIVPAHLLAAVLSAPLFIEVRQFFFHSPVEIDISPPLPILSLISVLRI